MPRRFLSRRAFLQQMSCAPALFFPAALIGPAARLGAFRSGRANSSLFPMNDDRLTPQYPAPSPLNDILRFAVPGTDEYAIEGYVAEIMTPLLRWREQLKASPATATLHEFVDVTIEWTPFTPVRETVLRPGDAISVSRQHFASDSLRGRDGFLREIKKYLSAFEQIETADFEIYECTQISDSPLELEAKIRYDFVGTRGQTREEHIGSWLTHWARSANGTWRVSKWKTAEETVSRAAGPIFADITAQAFGQTDSYRKQLLFGADYWRTILDGAIGVDVYGNNGVAVGDFDNDSRDDIYVCQPAGLPNRLYRNRGDGTFEDVTQKSGVGVLDFTACALFADFGNRGVQDLLVVCATGPILFSNDGKGSFTRQPEAFRFVRPPQGAFTHAALADYDHDGHLDIYFCLYNYYQGLDQYRYPVPYFDARNGPPNYLFHNEGNGIFQDRTEAAGLNAENDRYSFACSWGDANGDGWPDLYVVNDFGRNNLYRNNGDGTFAAVSSEARVNEAGAGMSACWLDFDNDGKQDIYAAGMWVADGMRVFGDPHFHAGESEKIRNLYHRHMAGNSLYVNQGNGTFHDEGQRAGVAMGRWSWSTDSWDFDHDGFPDLYVANGYISGIDSRDVSSFFWRQVVAKSPQDATPSPAYEHAWSAMNELIRSDATWNGHERNVFLANNRDGTFSDVSGVVGMDFRDDSRAFALSDLDGDGRLEVVLKNRNSPQLRLLRVATQHVGNAVALRLRGHTSNRDAIGAAVTVTAGTVRQTKYLQAGSGFLSQHTKELFFGVGPHEDRVSITVRWPNGLLQAFDNIPVNHRVEIEEGVAAFREQPFLELRPRSYVAGESSSGESLPASAGTWLIDPVKAPGFELPDLSGNLHNIREFRGRTVLLSFWKSDSSSCRDQLNRLLQAQQEFTSGRITIIGINVDASLSSGTISSLFGVRGPTFPVLLATPELSALYSIVFRYLFDRHRDLPLPTSFLIDEDGNIIKVYRGILTSQQLSQDLETIPRNQDQRLSRALPFPGTLCQDNFRRNLFTLGVAFFQHGYLQEATESFKQVIAEKPDDPDALYNLGTLYLRRNSPNDAQQYLEQAIKLRPNYPEAWNNLGMLAGQRGDTEEAVRYFEKALQLRPSYATAFLNLGNLYRREGKFKDSEDSLIHALASEPGNPEINYSLGMLYARQDEIGKAEVYLEKAISIRPDYSDALNNLGVLFVQTKHYREAEQRFQDCISKAPDFDQAYLNLARLYVVLDKREEARSTLRALLQKQPRHEMAQQMLQMLY